MVRAYYLGHIYFGAYKPSQRVGYKEGNNVTNRLWFFVFLVVVVGGKGMRITME